MQLTFLAAKEPLTKTFRQTPKTKQIKKVRSYPLVTEVSSTTVDVADLEQLAAAIEEAGSAGMALLKGHPNRKLCNESRAGSTDPLADTDYLVLDLDFDHDVPLDEALEAIAPELLTVDRVIQWSSSAGLGEPKLRCHVFFALSSSVAPARIKHWIQARNLRSDLFAQHLSLTANGMALRYPLDTSVNQNDKIIFIAPPVCQDFDDPMSDRVVFVPGDKPLLTLDFGAGTTGLAPLIIAKVAELRAEQGLKAKNLRLDRTDAGTQILANPDPCEVTETKNERGFTYLNLNGGDSWGYYYPDDNPTLLYNFKDEPVCYLKDICPKYYRDLMVETDAKAAESGEDIPLAFIDADGDNFYRGFYNPEANTFNFTPTTAQNAKNFMLSQGRKPPAFWPYHRLTFDPQNNQKIMQADDGTLTFNQFTPTPYMDMDATSDTIPPTIDRLLESLCAGDQATKDHLTHWLAWVLRKREKTQTAWLFRGVVGTGKGVLFHHVLVPLFGDSAVFIQPNSLLEKYTGFQEKALIIFADEVKLDRDDTMANLRTWITEPKLELRAMYRNSREVLSYCNWMFSSNHHDTVKMGLDDRRYNVAPFQHEGLIFDSIDLRNIATELEDFAAYLHGIDLQESRVRRPLQSEARDELRELSATNSELFFEALKSGDFDWFLEFMPDSPDSHNATSVLEFEQYKRDLKAWASPRFPDGGCGVTRDEVLRVYSFICRGGAKADLTRAGFSRLCRTHGFALMKNQRFCTTFDPHNRQPKKLIPWQELPPAEYWGDEPAPSERKVVRFKD